MVIKEPGNSIVEAIRNCTGIIYLVGNGGSAANAAHFATDLIKLGYTAFSLADHVSTITMIANDLDYQFTFSAQLRGIRSDDILIALSVSGKSLNVLNALTKAKYSNVMTIGLTGKDGGSLNRIVDICYHAGTDDYREAENEHMVYLHGLLKELE